MQEGSKGQIPYPGLAPLKFVDGTSSPRRSPFIRDDDPFGLHPNLVMTAPHDPGPPPPPVGILSVPVIRDRSERGAGPSQRLARRFVVSPRRFVVSTRHLPVSTCHLAVSTSPPRGEHAPPRGEHTPPRGDGVPLA